MKDSKLFAYLGAISAAISVFQFLSKTIENARVTFSPFMLIGIIVCVLFFVIHSIVTDPKTLYNIRKIICYCTRCGESYSVESKECTYIFLTRTKMRFEKKHKIVSNVTDLNHFSDKFKWSKEQKTDEIKIKSNNPRHQLSLNRIENWHQYTVAFDEIGKGQTETISITVDDLDDPEQESMLFLSANVVCRTKVLKLAVHIKDTSLTPTNIKYKVYDNYACEFPIFQEELTMCPSERIIERTEKMPIYGYRYVISWDFA